MNTLSRNNNRNTTVCNDRDTTRVKQTYYKALQLVPARYYEALQFASTMILKPGTTMYGNFFVG